MTALLLAAHGDGDGSASNEWARELALLAGSLGGFTRYGVAFQKGTPGFSEALEGIGEEEVVVVPLMAAAGYYAGTILPRELEKNRNYSKLNVVLSEPIGTLPEFHELAEKRVRALLAQLGWCVERTSIVVVGHGTHRHHESRRSTELLAVALAGTLRPFSVTPAFLDEDPGPEETVRAIAGDCLLVLPFLMGSGTHATKDLPSRLSGANKPLHIDQPLGTLPGIEHLILLRARKGQRV